MKILKATHPEGAVYWKSDKDGDQTSSDGINWNFTFRNEEEWREMFKNCKIEQISLSDLAGGKMEIINKLALDLGLFIGYLPDGSLRIAEKDFTN